MTATSPRVLIVAREPIGRLGLETLIEREGMVIAGSVASCAEALEALPGATPDVTLLARLTDRQPIPEAVRALREAAPAVPVVVVSSSAGPKEVAASIDAGAASWISARAPTSEIVAALRAVGTGLVVLSRSSTRPFLDGGNQLEAGQSRATPAIAAQSAIGHRIHPGVLSERERELLRLLGSGRSSSEIAETMGLAVETVRRSIHALTEKLAEHFPASIGGLRDQIA